MAESIIPGGKLINILLTPEDHEWLKKEAQRNFRQVYAEGGSIIHEMRDIRSKNQLGLKFPGEGKEA